MHNLRVRLSKFSYPLFILLFFNISCFSQIKNVSADPAQQLSHPQLKKLDSLILANDFGRMTSILVAKDGKLIYEKYYQDTDANTLHNTRSATKTFGSILAGIAIDQGYISSEKALIMDYLKHKEPYKNPDPRKEKITLEDLLTMSSILECDDNNSASRGQEERMYVIEDWTQFYIDLPIQGFAPWQTKPEESPYGRNFRYCTAGANAVNEIVQSAIKVKLENFTKTQLFDPLEITDYKLQFSPTGVMINSGGHNIKSSDFLKLAQLYLNKGKWNGQQIISEEWVEKSTTPKLDAFNDLKYGYLFWLGQFGPEGKKQKAFFMSGNGGNKVMGFPDLNLAVVITSRNYNTRNMHQISHQILDEFVIPTILESSK